MLGKIEEGDILCTNCQVQLDRLTKLGLLTDIDLAILRNPKRALTVHYPINRDNGTQQIVTGFRIQYNDALGPTKGGIRMHKSVNLDDVTELAFLMSLKTSLVGLPYGGAKGGIKVSPKGLSEKEREQVIRGFVRQIAHFIGPDHDIPAPDVNTNAEVMAMMLDEYEKVTGTKSPAAFTGKPFALGGSLGRETATSKGGYYLLKEMYKETEPENTTVAIQGFGNVGSYLAEMLYDDGFKIVAVSDSSGGIHDNNGLPIREIIRWKKEGKSISDLIKNPSTDLTGSEQEITNEKLLELDVDILAPSALGGVITIQNASKIKARTIIEMANAPIKPEADEVLSKRDVHVVPDILANAGGVIVSYFEWLQNKEGEQWSIKKVDNELQKKILPAYKAVMKESELRPKLDMRTVCYLLAVKRILEAEKNVKKD